MRRASCSTISSYSCAANRDLHSFPTRRSSDLLGRADMGVFQSGVADPTASMLPLSMGGRLERDRKSTRLNSSHTVNSYAVFCLKKKRRNARERAAARPPFIAAGGGRAVGAYRR